MSTWISEGSGCARRLAGCRQRGLITVLSSVAFSCVLPESPGEGEAKEAVGKRVFSF